MNTSKTAAAITQQGAFALLRKMSFATEWWGPGAVEWWGSAARAEAVLSSSSEELLELADELGQPTFAEFGEAKCAARAAVLAELRRRADAR